MARLSQPLTKRFWKKVHKTPSCWIWTGRTTIRDRKRPNASRYTYGVFDLSWRPTRATVAHRVAYSFTKGSIPNGMQLDHLCRNTLCVNPEHLEAVTHKENLLRSLNPIMQAHRNHTCTKGHRLNEQTAYQNRKTGRLRCKICTHVYQKTQRERISADPRRRTHWIRYNRRYQQRHRERIRQYHREYYLKHKCRWKTLSRPGSNTPS